MAENYGLHPICKHGADLISRDLSEIGGIARMRSGRSGIADTVLQQRLCILHHNALKVGGATFGRTDMQDNLLRHEIEF